MSICYVTDLSFAAFLVSKPWFIISGWGGFPWYWKFRFPTIVTRCHKLPANRPQTDTNTGWSFNKHFLCSPRSLGFHDPIWLYNIFQRGGLKPPTRTVFFDGCLFFCLSLRIGWLSTPNETRPGPKRICGFPRKLVRLDEPKGEVWRSFSIQIGCLWNGLKKLGLTKFDSQGFAVWN